MGEKKHNRAVFEERLLHRYLWETYYQSRAASRHLLPVDPLPRSGRQLREHEINLVVPEMVTNEQYVADLMLYFKEFPNKVPVEVKWQQSAFTSSEQLRYLKKHDGFGVCFEAPTGRTIPDTNIPLVGMDQEKFLTWLASNVTRLANETFDAKAGISASADHSPAYWLLMLKGQEMLANFERMRRSVASGQYRQHFWALKNRTATVLNLLRVRAGDRLIIVDGRIVGAKGHGLEGGSGASRRHSLDVRHWYEATVRIPYFMVVDPKDPRGLFFEKGRPQVGDRVWPHFLDFSSLELGGGRTEIRPLGNFFDAFRSSWNGGGVLHRLHLDEAHGLRDRLRRQK